MDIIAEVRSLENMDSENGGVGEGGNVVRVDDGGAGDAVTCIMGLGGIDGGGAGDAAVLRRRLQTILEKLTPF